MKILSELFLTFAKIGLFTFGGGYAMIPLIEHECVDKKHWLEDDELLELTILAESTPGPISINCATHTGYKQAGMKGAIAATFGMVLPSFVIILLISLFFENLLQYPVVANAFRGIRVAVGLLIVRAAIRMVKKLLKKKGVNKPLSVGFVLIFFATVMTLNLLEVGFSTIWLILIAGVLGFCLFGLPRRKRAAE